MTIEELNEAQAKLTEVHKLVKTIERNQKFLEKYKSARDDESLLNGCIRFIKYPTDNSRNEGEVLVDIRSCDDAEFYAHAKDVLINEMISKYENTIAKLKKQLDNIQINIVENAQ